VNLNACTLKRAALLGLMASLYAACDRGQISNLHLRAEASSDSESASASSSTQSESLLTRANALREAELALRKQLDAPIVALELRIFPERVVLQAQNPKHPESVIQYEYRAGRVAGPSPVELRGPGQLSDNLFPLAEANLMSVPDVVAKALQKVKSSQAQVGSVVLRRNLPVATDLRFRVYVTTPERSSRIEADGNGKLVESS
jgi:hypothetical protein